MAELAEVAYSIGGARGAPKGVAKGSVRAAAKVVLEEGAACLSLDAGADLNVPALALDESARQRLQHQHSLLLLAPQTHSGTPPGGIRTMSCIPSKCNVH